jgi:hypothetical protein
MFCNFARRPAAILALLLIGPSSSLPGQVPEDIGRPTVGLHDTGRQSAAPLLGKALTTKTGWTRLPEDETEHEFSGDVVLANDRLSVVLRQNGPGAEVYCRGSKGPILRAVLAPACDNSAVRLRSVAVVRNSPAEVAVDALFKSGAGRTLGLRYELGLGQAFVKTEAHKGVKALCVAAPCRFVVLPDFFADDIVVDATEIPVTAVDLPSENFLLHMLPDHDAIVMSVANTREQDARITLSGDDTERVIDGSKIHYGKDGKIWVAVIEGRNVWHQRDIAREDAGEVLSLDWKVPYMAQWRVDWQCVEGLSDSWEMLTQEPSGEFIKHGWFGQPESLGTPDWMHGGRRRWTTVLGRFQYPCWVDNSGRGYLQPLKKKTRFQGPAIIYPINRLQATPIDKLTVVDIVRATLGVGPCEYVLDVEGQQKKSQGIATCSARTKLNEIYKQRLQKQKRAEVEKALVDVLAFVQHIRVRIEEYVAFGHDMLDYLAEQKKACPELTEPITEMETLARKIDDYVAIRKAGIGTLAQAVKLVEDFRTKLIDYEGDDALERCQAFGKAITRIGGNQDELVGECRVAVKLLRQRAGLIMATQPRMAKVAREIRLRTQDILCNPVSYEAPRH